MRLTHPRSLFALLCAAVSLCSSLPVFGNVAPEFTQPSSTPVLRTGSPLSLDLRTFFRDPDVTGTAVRVSVRIGTTTKPVDIALFDQEKPITVANFLAYVNAGRTAANFFHRSVPGFVVQGGGFLWNEVGNVDAVVTFPKIQNEPGISNVRGTVAMAKLSGDPNSATSQWFVNLADNSANLDAQNGGFTVFGRVLGNGMAVIDEVAALPRYNAGSAFDSLPLKDFSGSTILRQHTVETSTATIPTLSFSASSSDPALLGVSVEGSVLKLTPATNQSGVATVTVVATDLDGGSTTATVSVEVKGWHMQTGADGEASAFNLSSSPGAAVSSTPVPVQMGSINYGSSVTRTFTIKNDSPTTLPAVTAWIGAAAGTTAGDFTITSGAGPSDLAQGASTTVTVQFTPAAGGPRNAVLHIRSAEQPPLDLALSGTGIDNEAPTVSPIAPQVLTAGVRRTAQVPDLRQTLVTATDNVAVVSISQTPVPGTVLLEGAYTLSFSARDQAGNVTTVQNTLTVAYDAATAPQLEVSAAGGGAPVPEQSRTDLPSGSYFSVFGTPAIDDQRNLAARVTIAAGKSRLAAIYWESESGQNKLVALQGKASGLPVASFKSFRDPVLAPGGAIAFGATVSGVKTTENEGVWTDLFGSLQPVLQKGGVVPGLDGLRLKSVTSLSLGDDALLALVKLVPAPGLVTTANDTALIRITGPTSATLLARTGTGFDGSTIKQISVLQPAARSQGQGRWSRVGDTVAKFTLFDKRAVVVQLKADGTKLPLLQSGIADAKLGTTLATLGLPALGNPGVAVLATKSLKAGATAASDTVLLYAADGANFSEVVREEPGASKFASFSDPVINDQGELLFFGTARAAAPKTPNTTGLWLTDGVAAPELVASVGAPAVDREGHPLSNTTWSNITSFALPDGPGAGPAFVAQLSGKAVNAHTKLGLWALDSGGLVRLLLRTGDNLTLANGTKEVTNFTLLNSLPGSFGARRSYNATGALAVQVTFKDHTQAILRVNVP